MKVTISPQLGQIDVDNDRIVFSSIYSSVSLNVLAEASPTSVGLLGDGGQYVAKAFLKDNHQHI